ncbi:MAG: DUF1015 family protein, partial [Spirochaetia bacterium]
MQHNFKDFQNIGIEVPEILIPNSNIDLKKWAVIACDQFTSEPEVWNKIESYVGEEKSTLRLILPELYLGVEDVKSRIQSIWKNMDEYLNGNTFQKLEPGFIYVERTTQESGTRKGLILAVDLEAYDFQPGSKSLIKATEGTIIERIPPRKQIREKAALELPHILLLIDDPDKNIIESLSDKKDTLEKLYDFELMDEGGHIEGYHVRNEADLVQLLGGFRHLA